ncbi:EthD domain-containing protein [Podospora appendiculata]|uniref:EthD domain-containing protein n=1 Tax=Podospora appendiculata TaxID=314037 RepID=A0AAE1CG02_9PEZI|nr:EthD domain-containing protein [Podospora appendiculata]
MVFTILIFSTRKPGTTPAEYRAAVEEVVLPFLKDLAGEHFPIKHERYYIQRVETPKTEGNTEHNPTTPAVVFVGAQADFDYDSVSTLTFADQAAFGAYVALMQRPENAASIAEVEGRFLDTSKTSIVPVGEAAVTARE